MEDGYDIDITKLDAEADPDNEIWHDGSPQGIEGEKVDWQTD